MYRPQQHTNPNRLRRDVCARNAAPGSRLVIALVLAAVAGCFTGCSTLQGVRNYIAYNDTQNDFVIGWRNRVWAIQAWHMEREKYLEHPYLAEFGDGFRTGFRDVASGGTGCPPVVPPRKYWSWKYQSPEGQAKVAAWFEGFPVGAMVAERNQAGEFSDIPVSYTVEAQYSPRFRAGELPGLPPPTYTPRPPISEQPPSAGNPPLSEDAGTGELPTPQLPQPSAIDIQLNGSQPFGSGYQQQPTNSTRAAPTPTTTPHEPLQDGATHDSATMTRPSLGTETQLTRPGLGSAPLRQDVPSLPPFNPSSTSSTGTTLGSPIPHTSSLGNPIPSPPGPLQPSATGVDRDHPRVTNPIPSEPGPTNSEPRRSTPLEPPPHRDSAYPQRMPPTFQVTRWMHDD